VVFEASWIVVLSSDGEAPTVAFMHSEHPSTPPKPAAFAGDGTFLTLQADDASAEYECVREDGLNCALEPTDEPRGQRRFAAIDPAACGSTWWSRRSQQRGGGTATPRQATATKGRYPSPSAPVAQLDRASVYGTEGLRFES
jgi:hypothetical protein